MTEQGNVISFIGLYASFPVTKTERRSQILNGLLELERPLPFKKMKYGQTLGRIQETQFTDEAFTKVLQSLQAGDADYLDLISYSRNMDWTESYRNSVALSWSSSFYEIAHRPLSPVERHFGFSGTIRILYPLARFSFESESLFQHNLLSTMKKLFVEQEMHWCFIHKGQRQIQPSSVGVDDIFMETRSGFPLSSFQQDLYSFSRYSKDYVRGAFWANFLNPSHAKLLGGLSYVKRKGPASIIEELSSERVPLQVGLSPLVNDETKSVADYQKLRSFLRPILLETQNDWNRVHKEVIGSWGSSLPK